MLARVLTPIKSYNTICNAHCDVEMSKAQFQSNLRVFGNFTTELKEYMLLFKFNYSKVGRVFPVQKSKFYLQHLLTLADQTIG